MEIMVVASRQKIILTLFFYSLSYSAVAKFDKYSDGCFDFHDVDNMKLRSLSIPKSNLSKITLCNLNGAVSVYAYTVPTIEDRVCYIKGYEYSKVNEDAEWKYDDQRDYYAHMESNKCPEYKSDTYIDFTYASKSFDRSKLVLDLSKMVDSFSNGDYKKYINLSLYDILFSNSLSEFKREVKSGYRITIDSVFRNPLSDSNSLNIVEISIGRSRWHFLIEIDDGNLKVKKIIRLI
ncbi:hypothetical protein [Gallaecimonas mangrovi]|uniref:hypothetical protein n=1 Tax=Gallaecimonas mangrovi TaxID=2291597 RepID=UPI0012603D73|nr:hypothetical protein [Gallaecimonas mangrovi]